MKVAHSGAGAGADVDVGGAVTTAKPASVAIMWFRRDLRMVDNTALDSVVSSGAQILPVFIFTPTQISDKKNEFKSNKSVQFMIESLIDLDVEIEKYGGSGIFCFYGEPDVVLAHIATAFGADAVYFNADYTPYSKQRDSAVERALERIGVRCEVSHDVCLTVPGSVTTGGKAYQKYTPFYMRVMAERDSIRRPSKAHKTIRFISGDEAALRKGGVKRISLREAYTTYTSPSAEISAHGGRENGEAILRDIRTHQKYGETRNDLEVSTTNLSAYLKYGCLSVREVYAKIGATLGASHDLIRQLVWRDFYIHLMDAFPHVIGHELKPAYDKIRWKRNEKWLSAWKEGRTGFPVVDAGMRQLATTGFMHNRVRMITASFLIKTLLIDWREGERHFAQSLVDYDPAANNGNWQWVAGTGADSQPYFRVFNPWLQSEKHDPRAVYIKKWVPELEAVDARDIHRWHDEKVRAKYAGRVEYVEPIVVFETQRAAVLEMYKSALY